MSVNTVLSLEAERHYQAVSRAADVSFRRLPSELRPFYLDVAVLKPDVGIPKYLLEEWWGCGDRQFNGAPLSKTAVVQDVLNSLTSRSLLRFDPNASCYFQVDLFFCSVSCAQNPHFPHSRCHIPTRSTTCSVTFFARISWARTAPMYPSCLRMDPQIR